MKPRTAGAPQRETLTGPVIGVEGDAVESTIEVLPGGLGPAEEHIGVEVAPAQLGLEGSVVLGARVEVGQQSCRMNEAESERRRHRTGAVPTLVAIAAAWAYSAEPVRLKRSGILGPGLVGLSYESLPWFTGAAVLSAGAPSWPIVITALLYGIGAHGIMTLNDFKALEGDRQMGVNSLPVTLGPRRAALVAAWVMAIPQFIVILLMFHWDRPWFGFFITASLLAQIAAMQVLMQNPKERAPWYNATGVSLYVSGMMIAAFGLRGLGG